MLCVMMFEPERHVLFANNSSVNAGMAVRKEQKIF